MHAVENLFKRGELVARLFAGGAIRLAQAPIRDSREQRLEIDRITLYIVSS